MKKLNLWFLTASFIGKKLLVPEQSSPASGHISLIPMNDSFLSFTKNLKRLSSELAL